MTTKLSDVADFISEIELSEKDASRLRQLMTAWSSDFDRSHRGLMQVPGFRKIWEALEESAAMSLRFEDIIDR